MGNLKKEMEKEIMVYEDKVRRNEDELQEINNYYMEIKNNEDDELERIKKRRQEIVMEIMRLDTYISGNKYVLNNIG